jgi:hypothetical protein
MSQAAEQFIKDAPADRNCRVDGKFYPIGLGDAELFIPDSMDSREIIQRACTLAITTECAVSTCINDQGEDDKAFGSGIAQTAVFHLQVIAALLEHEQFGRPRTPAEG